MYVERLMHEHFPQVKSSMIFQCVMVYIVDHTIVHQRICDTIYVPLIYTIKNVPEILIHGEREFTHTNVPLIHPKIKPCNSMQPNCCNS